MTPELPDFNVSQNQEKRSILDPKIVGVQLQSH